MKEVPFIGGSYQGRSSDVNSQKTKNLYLIKDEKGGRDRLYGTPGLVEFVEPTP